MGKETWELSHPDGHLCRDWRCDMQKMDIRKGMIGFLAFSLLVAASFLFTNFSGMVVLPGCTYLKKKPNIILIVIDTARADYFSYTDEAKAKTPNVDLFAKECVNYSNAHSVSPWTLPSHMSFFTGLLPGEHGATWSAFSNPPDMSMADIMAEKFAPKEPRRLLANRLKNMGYVTMGFSANPWISNRNGFDQGFDYFCDTWRLKAQFRKIYPSLNDELKISLPVDSGDAGWSLLLWKSYLERNEISEPFFLFFNLIDPHFPYYPPAEFMKETCTPKQMEEMYDNRGNELAMIAGQPYLGSQTLLNSYQAEMQYVDFVLGKMLSYFREKGIYDNSLIILTSDHGEHLGENGHYSHQLSIEEELLRIPLLIKYPNGENAGHVEKNPLISNLDIYQTVLSAADSSLEPDQGGREIWSENIRAGKGVEREFLAAEYYYSNAYLGQLKKAYQNFDPEPHKVVKRAIYFENDAKINFWNEELKSVVGQVGNSSDMQSAQAFVRKQIEAAAENNTEKASGNADGSASDGEFVDKLKSLGYVGD